MWKDYGGRRFGFYPFLLRFLIVEEYMDVLYAQFNMHVLNNGFSFSESEKMGIDEFDLLIKMYDERQKELKKMARSF